ncbi:NUMOD4 motif-containing HNH endonuclease [Pedobacter sp.]|uniref:NUMOD4 motif-containing HNH endonuclease n=1 Tax=Pedobacter sp. TaxID=1411316 RepID=UPI003C32BBC5
MKTEQERYVPVAGYEGFYEVSTHGNIRSVDRTVIRNDGTPHFCKGRVLINKFFTGYARVCLSKNNIHQDVIVHRIVCSAFHGEGKPNYQVNHIDGDKRNNHYTNLEWLSALENIRHATSTGLMKRKGHFNPASKQVINTSTGEVFGCAKEAFMQYGKWGYSYFSMMLCDRAPNKTPYRYVA